MAERPVKFIVPFFAGGTTDILGRLVAQKLSEEYGQQFIVENKPGAGGNIAADFVAKSDPDGYTFIVGTPGTHAINKYVQKNMPYDPIKDIQPVTIIARVPNLMSVNPEVPAKSVAEFLALAKSKPGQLFYGTPGPGHHGAPVDRTVQVDDRHRHRARPLQRQRAGTHRSGRRPRSCHDRQSSSCASVRREQQCASSGVSTAEKWPLLPNILTIGETVKGYDAAAWFTVAAPAKVSKDIVMKLNASIIKYIKSPDGIERIRKLGGEPVGNTPEEMQAFVIAETEKWARSPSSPRSSPNNNRARMRRHHMAPHPGTFHPAMLLCRTWRNRFPQAISGARLLWPVCHQRRACRTGRHSGHPAVLQSGASAGQCAGGHRRPAADIRQHSLCDLQQARSRTDRQPFGGQRSNKAATAFSYASEKTIADIKAESGRAMPLATMSPASTRSSRAGCA
jgi:tripartite-type tricarboxylate transporter receptor subunit TctC